MHHPLPESALDGDIAILGRKGGGKTVTAKGIVERLLRLKRRVLIFDPLGGWWGLRADASGEGAGFPIAVIGGDHGDRPLVPGIAVPLADVIAHENLPCVIDIADAKQNVQREFLLAFLHELRRVNREPLTIVLEEADVFAPQSPARDLTKELHDEIDWLARRGRARGFRLITICQRPARLSKDVLTQAQTLIAHVLPSPQDRDAVKAWVEGNGDRDAAKEVFDTLGKLHTGEAWTWVTDPRDGFLRRVHFPMIKTFDSTKTPRAGERRIEPKTLAEVDVSAIDKAIKKEAAPKGAPVLYKDMAADMKAATDRAYSDGYQTGNQHGLSKGRSESAIYLTRLRVDLAAEITSYLETAINELNSPGTPSPEPATKRVADTTAPVARPRRAKANGGDTSSGKISDPFARIMNAIAWWNALGVDAPSQTRVAFIAGYRATSGTWRAYMSRMKAEGLITAANKTLRLTDTGARLAVSPGTPPTFAAAREAVKAELPEPLQRILANLIEAYPGSVLREKLATLSGYQNSGSFRTYLARLSGLGLVKKEMGGRVCAPAFLFGVSNG